MSDERIENALNALAAAKQAVRDAESAVNDVATTVGMEMLTAAGLAPGARFSSKTSAYRGAPGRTSYWQIGQGFSSNPYDREPTVVLVPITKAGERHRGKDFSRHTVSWVISRALANTAEATR